VLNGDSLRRQENLRAAKVYAPAVAIREVGVRESTGFIASVLVGLGLRRFVVRAVNSPVLGAAGICCVMAFHKIQNDDAKGKLLWQILNS
jgi:hypothetical protein